ncbi:MAG TPA: efflux RND transporter periplasmic adaptor subunit [candidate division Zixibacteria bacterium]|nr:efflux RND transporter periplasmic adaptor subunit [candidate division Zixibacteria bacterium]
MEGDADLAALRIDRPERGGPWRRRRALRLVLRLVGLLALAGAAFVLWGRFRPGIEVRLAAVSLTSPSQARAVLTASGYVVARRKAAVASKGTGTLVYLGVEEGDSVKKGQVIARLDDADVVAALRRAQENLRLAEADLHDARENLERQRRLLAMNLIAQADYDAADARYQRVVASIGAARFAVEEARVAVENTRIVAPFDGTVVQKNADVGEIVAPLAGAASSRAAVVTIADMSSLEVEADVSEANITRVLPEQECEITLDAYPEHRYPGYVSKIVPTADRAKATVMVKIKFGRYDRRVLPEMSAKVAFLSPATDAGGRDARPFLTVPETAVAEREGRRVVYRVRDGRAVETPVVIGRKVAGLIEVKEGLKEGERVVSRATEALRDGVRVTVKGQ